MQLYNAAPTQVWDMAVVASLNAPQEQDEQLDDDEQPAAAAAAGGSSSAGSSSSKRAQRAAGGSSAVAAVPHCTLRTKATPVYSLRYTDRNLLLVGGAFSVDHSKSTSTGFS
jgi:hypothetical protein